MIIVVKKLQTHTKLMQPGIIFIIYYLIFNGSANNTNAIVENLYFFIFLLQTFFIDGYALSQIIFQSFGCPLAELGSSYGFYSIPNRNDDIQIIKSNWLIRIRNMHFLHIAFFYQFSFFEHINQVPGNNRLIFLKQYG